MTFLHNFFNFFFNPKTLFFNFPHEISKRHNLCIPLNDQERFGYEFSGDDKETRKGERD